METVAPVKHRKPRSNAHDHTVLVLQGGGALGAYQAGVYEGLAESGYVPDWVAGVSIGAVNAALIAGNRPEDRVPRLKAFWDLVSSGIPLTVPPSLNPFRLELNRVSAMATATFGVPGFFSPRIPPAYFAPEGTHEAISLYDTSPLRQTLLDLVDFERIKQHEVRLSVGTVNVRTGNSVYFDNRSDDPRLLIDGPEQIMASGALPPGFPPVTIGKDEYWDGGLVSNTPLWQVQDDSLSLDALVFQVDLFSASGALPRNLDQAMERSKDIQYSSKTRLNTRRVKEVDDLSDALHRLLNRLPAGFRSDPDYLKLSASCRPGNMSIVHLINRRPPTASNSKDYEFSRTTIRELWAEGLKDVRRTMAHPDFQNAIRIVPGVRTFDLTR